MGKSVPVVCFLLFALSGSVFKGNAQKNEDNSISSQSIGTADQLHSASVVMETLKSPFKVNPVAQTNSFPDNYSSVRLSKMLAYKYRGAEASNVVDGSISRGTIAYRSTVAALLGVGLLIAMALLIKRAIRKMKQKTMQKDFSMTYRDARLSSQFLSDFSGSERSEKKVPHSSLQAAKTKPVIIDILTATPPIPSQISLTSPTGQTKKFIWTLDDDFVKVDLSERHAKNVSRRTSSLPSLTSDQDQSSSSTESRDSYRRDAVLLLSDDEGLIANLKKKRKKQKKSWKKIIKTSPMKTY